MNRRSRFLARTVGWGAIAVLALTTLTPLDASADHKRSRRHRNCDPPRRVVVHHQRTVDRGACDVVVRPNAFVVFDGDRFYWSASAGLYVPRVLVNVNFGNQPPRGSAYYDPQCDRTFRSLQRYRSHLGRKHHPQVVEVREVRDRHDHDSCSNDSDWDDD
jgi:hypothetical protein